jgi:rRNA maturation endonuclease Nob1
MSLSKAERNLYESNVMQALGVAAYPDRDRGNHYTPFPITSSVETCSQCHEDVPAGLKRCPYCGNQFKRPHT